MWLLKKMKIHRGEIDDRNIAALRHTPQPLDKSRHDAVIERIEEKEYVAVGRQAYLLHRR